MGYHITSVVSGWVVDIVGVHERQNIRHLCDVMENNKSYRTSSRSVWHNHGEGHKLRSWLCYLPPRCERIIPTIQWHSEVRVQPRLQGIKFVQKLTHKVCVVILLRFLMRFYNLLLESPSNRATWGAKRSSATQRSPTHHRLVEAPGPPTWCLWSTPKLSSSLPSSLQTPRRGAWDHQVWPSTRVWKRSWLL